MTPGGLPGRQGSLEYAGYTQVDGRQALQLEETEAAQESGFVVSQF